MITRKYSEGQIAELYGRSSDTKPEDAPNASLFLEMDTSKLYIFDAESHVWYEVGAGSTSEIE